MDNMYSSTYTCIFIEFQWLVAERWRPEVCSVSRHSGGKEVEAHVAW